MKSVKEWFLKYIMIPSASKAGVEASPSTPEQMEIAKVVVQDMLDIGISDARVDEYGYVYGSIPANCEGQKSVGLIAHLDVVDDVPCSPMKPRIIDNYDGSIITLDNGLVLDPKVFPSLLNCAGKQLITTDGNTLLGADDKAGVAEIMTLAEMLITHPEIKHGDVKIAFTPDEEVGGGAEYLDIPAFGADFAYTVDGGEIGGIEYENFNAAGAKIFVKGVNIHPGSAKDKMKNAALIAAEFISMLPASETPAHTEKYEGFYHLGHMEGDEENALLEYIIRDHDKVKFENKKAFFAACADHLNLKYGEGTVSLQMSDSYYNMREVMEKHMYVVERAVQAFETCGVKPFIEPIRGGTDGARLSWRGLPCPNLSTGGMNAHGRSECACVDDMQKMVEVLLEIVKEK